VYSQSYYLNVFNTLAPHYWVVELVSLGMSNKLRRTAVANASIREGSTVVDLMCGTGNNMDYIGDDVEYLGMDTSEAMILCARNKYDHSRNVKFIHSNVLLPSQHHFKADHILCSYGLKCIASEQYRAFVDTIDAMLNRGGTLSMVEFQLPKNRILKWLMKLYLNVFYKALCYLFVSDATPATALIRNLEQPVELDLLVSLLRSKRFEVQTKKKFAGAVVSISALRSALF
jgi:ubiquinone/menaquinone biosynthesis C-methylase UbiE